MNRIFVVAGLLMFQLAGFAQTEGHVERTLIAADSSDTILLTVDFAYYPQSENAYEKAVNDHIVSSTKEWIREKQPDLTLSKQYFESVLEGFAFDYENEEDPMGAIWSLEEAMAINEFDSWVQLKHSGWSYTGGAHGNSFFTATVFDREDGSVLKLEDFFTDVDALNSLMEPLFRKEKGLGENESLKEAGFDFKGDKFRVMNNFFFTGRSFVVYFNSYDIAAYAAGPTELEISLDKIEHLLKRDI